MRSCKVADMFVCFVHIIRLCIVCMITYPYVMFEICDSVCGCICLFVKCVGIKSVLFSQSDSD